jgi:hypothetical protein
MECWSIGVREGVLLRDSILPIAIDMKGCRPSRPRFPALSNLAKVPISPSEIEAPDRHDNSNSYVEGNYHAFRAILPGSHLEDL